MRTDKTINKNIFLCDVEIPRIVQEKADSALASVRKDAANGSMEESEMTGKTKKRNFKRWSGIAAAAAVVVMLGGGIVFAAINHFWSDGAKEVLEINEEQMQTLEEQGNIQWFDSAAEVTADGVTIRPMELVADSRSAMVTFLVSGLDSDVASGKELMFDYFHTELDEGSVFGADGRFYESRITDKNGMEGFEYIMHVHGRNDGSAALLGRQLHVDLKDLALSGGKAEVGEVLAQGPWSFDISLPAEDPAITMETEYPLSDSVYTVEQIKLSPLSLQVFYQVNGEVEMGRWDSNVPVVYGIRLKDGSEINISSSLESGYPALDRGPGSFLYEDPEAAAADEEVCMHPERAFAEAGFNQIIDPEEVAEVILQPWGEAYAWGDLPDEIVAEEYGGEIPFERVDTANVEYWNVPLE